MHVPKDPIAFLKVIFPLLNRQSDLSLPVHVPLFCFDSRVTVSDLFSVKTTCANPNIYKIN